MLLPYLLPLTLAVVLLQPQICDCRRLYGGGCTQNYARCHDFGKPWQRDGVCLDIKYCHAPREAKFSFNVEAKLRKLQAGSGNAVRSLWMRGTGIGLSWDNPIQLRRRGTSIGAWKAELTYRSSSDGILCSSLDFCTKTQQGVEFRLYRDREGKDNMVGPNFYISLPISNSLKGSSVSLSPSVTVYPWFDGEEVFSRKEYMRSSLSVTARQGELQTTIEVLFPPSFNHNSLKHYPLVLVFGYELMTISPLLERLYVHDATIHEAVVVGIEPYEQMAPYAMLSPFSHTYIWMCKDRDCFRGCQTCWKRNKEWQCNREDFIEQAELCLYPKKFVSKGEQVLDMIEVDILPKLKELTKDRLLVDFPKHRMSIIGVDGSGLLACYAAVTRPHIYQNAGCLSPPFYWPLSNSLTDPAPSPGIFNITLSKLKNDLLQNPRIASFARSQKYYIDVAKHEHHFLPIVQQEKYNEWFVKELQDTLYIPRENIMYFTVPGYYDYIHDSKGLSPIFHRIEHALRHFLKTEAEGPHEWRTNIQTTSDKTVTSHLLGTQANITLTQSCQDELYKIVSKPAEVPIIFFFPTLGR